MTIGSTLTLWNLWISGYCGRLFWTGSDEESMQYMALMHDGTQVTEEPLEVLRWMIGNYLRRHREGIRPTDPALVQLASQNDMRPLYRGSAEYR